MTLLVFLIVLGILIIVHEWGHFIAARLLGIRVEKFSIGFGKKLVSRVSQGTEFIVAAIPLGGYVKLAGDERAECTGSADEFFSHPVWHRALVIVMGPLINCVFAYLCFVFLFSVTGYPILGNQIGDVMPDYPAAQAGLEPGDIVLEIDGQVVTHWADIQTAVFNSEGQKLDFIVERSGQRLELDDLKPVYETFDGAQGRQSFPVVGIKPKLKKYGLLRSLREAGSELTSIMVLTAKTLYRVATGAESAQDKLAGPIRIFDVIRDATAMGFAYIVFIMAVISANLAFFNLLPVPVLDGGHLFFLAFEAIRGRPLSEKVEEGFLKVGMSLLICLALFVFYNDIVQVGWAEKMTHFFGRFFQ